MKPWQVSINNEIRGKSSHMFQRFKSRIHTRAIVLVLFVLSFALAAYGNSNPKEYARSLSTEIMGAVLVYFIFERILADRQEKEKHIRQLLSKDNGLAMYALDELWACGAIRDGSLNEKYLAGVSLEGACFDGANLKRTNLSDSNLKGASFLGANLEQCELRNTNLENSILSVANLRGAILIEANLIHAELYDVDLRGADLRGATLRYAEIDKSRIQFDENTILPDGNYWDEDTDIYKFTRPIPMQFKTKGLWYSQRN